MITNVKNIQINKSILHLINDSNSHYNNTLLSTDDSNYQSSFEKKITSIMTKPRLDKSIINKILEKSIKVRPNRSCERKINIQGKAP